MLSALPVADVSDRPTNARSSARRTLVDSLLPSRSSNHPSPRRRGDIGPCHLRPL